MDEPTRGVDIATKADIYKEMDELTSSGTSILMISSELPELLNMCDRIVVLNEGVSTKVLNKDEFSQETIMYYATLDVKTLEYTDYLFASFEEAKELSHGLEAPDKIANFFYSNQFKGTFVLKLDKRGCFIANRDQTCNIPACEVLSVVDTTGAGDAFVSAFLFGIINGLSDEESGILGNVNGALAITKLGATSSTANLQNLVSTLQKDYTVHPLKNKLIEKMEMLAFDRTNNAIQV